MPVFLRQTLPLFLSFIGISLLTYVSGPLFTKWNIDPGAVRIGNSFLFLISLFSFYIQFRALKNPNPHAFVRGVMLSLLLKMVLVVLAVLLYYSLSGKAFNTRAVVACLFLYLVYLGVEGSMLTRMNKRKHA